MRPPTGSPRWSTRHGCWIARVSMPGKPGRDLVPIERVAREDVEGARRMAKIISDRMRNGGAVPLGSGETVAEYAKRWLEAREGRIASLRDNRAHLESHILPVIGTLEIARVNRGDVERLVSALDAKVRNDGLSAKTARNIWGTCSKLFDDATNAKPAEGLRCLASDPTNGVRPPDDDAADKLLQFLYPSELAQFLACEDVPLSWRRNTVIAIYLCLRDGEQRALKWPAVDLVHGIVTIQETFDRETEADREGTKTGTARMVHVRAELLPLLQAMHSEAKRAAEGKSRRAMSAPCRRTTTWRGACAHGSGTPAFVASNSTSDRASTNSSDGTTCARRARRGSPSRGAARRRSATYSGTRRRA